MAVDAQDNPLQNSGAVDASGPMALRATPDSSALGNQAAPPPAPPSTDLGQNPSTGGMPDMSAPKTPSLWRNVLRGALEGLAAGSKAKTFAGGLAMGAQGEEQMAQQRRENDLRQQQIDNAKLTQKAQSAYYVAETNKLALQLAQANPSSPEHHAMLAENNQRVNDDMIRGGGAAVMSSFDTLEDAQQFALKNNVNGVNGQIGAITGPDGKTKYGIIRYNAQPISKDMDIQTMGADGNPATQHISAGSMTYQQVAALRADNEKKLADAGYEQHKLSMQTASKKEVAQAGAATKIAVSTEEARQKQAIKATATPQWVPGVGADEKKKAELAENIADNANNVSSILVRRPDLVGAIAGRFTEIEQLVGNNDPSIAAVGTAIHNIAMANSGVHGFRANEGVKDTEKLLLNSFRNGPKAIGGALRALTSSTQTFIDNARPVGYRTHSQQGGALRGMMPQPATQTETPSVNQPTSLGGIPVTAVGNAFLNQSAIQPPKGQ